MLTASEDLRDAAPRHSREILDMKLAMLAKASAAVAAHITPAYRAWALDFGWCSHVLGIYRELDEKSFV